MAITPFLAMTAAEIEHSTPLPPNVAWMACHFSPYGAGLSNLPKNLPAGSLLIEMGAAGNSHPEALRAAEQLAYAIVTLAQGSQ